jgi:hypothetical protein
MKVKIIFKIGFAKTADSDRCHNADLIGPYCGKEQDVQWSGDGISELVYTWRVRHHHGPARIERSGHGFTFETGDPSANRRRAGSREQMAKGRVAGDSLGTFCSTQVLLSYQNDSGRISYSIRRSKIEHHDQVEQAFHGPIPCIGDRRAMARWRVLGIFRAAHCSSIGN